MVLLGLFLVISALSVQGLECFLPDWAGLRVVPAFFSS